MPDARLQRTREAYQPTVVVKPSDVSPFWSPFCPPFCAICGAHVTEMHHACCVHRLQQVVEPTEDTPWGV